MVTHREGILKVLLMTFKMNLAYILIKQRLSINDHRRLRALPSCGFD